MPEVKEVQVAQNQANTELLQRFDLAGHVPDIAKRLNPLRTDGAFDISTKYLFRREHDKPDGKVLGFERYTFAENLSQWLIGYQGKLKPEGMPDFIKQAEKYFKFGHEADHDFAKATGFYEGIRVARDMADAPEVTQQQLDARATKAKEAIINQIQNSKEKLGEAKRSYDGSGLPVIHDLVQQVPELKQSFNAMSDILNALSGENTDRSLPEYHSTFHGLKNSNMSDGQTWAKLVWQDNVDKVAAIQQIAYDLIHQYNPSLNPDEIESAVERFTQTKCMDGAMHQRYARAVTKIPDEYRTSLEAKRQESASGKQTLEQIAEGK